MGDVLLCVGAWDGGGTMAVAQRGCLPDGERLNGLPYLCSPPSSLLAVSQAYMLHRTLDAGGVVIQEMIELLGKPIHP